MDNRSLEVHVLRKAVIGLTPIVLRKGNDSKQCALEKGTYLSLRSDSNAVRVIQKNDILLLLIIQREVVDPCLAGPSNP